MSIADSLPHECWSFHSLYRKKYCSFPIPYCVQEGTEHLLTTFSVMEEYHRRKRRWSLPERNVRSIYSLRILSVSHFLHSLLISLSTESNVLSLFIIYIYHYSFQENPKYFYSSPISTTKSERLNPVRLHHWESLPTRLLYYHISGHIPRALAHSLAS